MRHERPGAREEVRGARRRSHPRRHEREIAIVTTHLTNRGHAKRQVRTCPAGAVAGDGIGAHDESRNRATSRRDRVGKDIRRVVMRIDQSRNDEPCARVENLGSTKITAQRVQRRIGHDLDDAIATHDDGAIGQRLRGPRVEHGRVPHDECARLLYALIRCPFRRVTRRCDGDGSSDTGNPRA